MKPDALRNSKPSRQTFFVLEVGTFEDRLKDALTHPLLKAPLSVKRHPEEGSSPSAERRRACPSKRCAGINRLIAALSRKCDEGFFRGVSAPMHATSWSARADARGVGEDEIVPLCTGTAKSRRNLPDRSRSLAGTRARRRNSAKSKTTATTTKAGWDAAAKLQVTFTRPPPDSFASIPRAQQLIESLSKRDAPFCRQRKTSGFDGVCLSFAATKKKKNSNQIKSDNSIVRESLRGTTGLQLHSEGLRGLRCDRDRLLCGISRDCARSRLASAGLWSDRTVRSLILLLARVCFAFVLFYFKRMFSSLF